MSDRRGCSAEMCGPGVRVETYDVVIDVAIKDRRVDRTLEGPQKQWSPMAPLFILADRQGLTTPLLHCRRSRGSGHSDNGK